MAPCTGGCHARFLRASQWRESFQLDITTDQAAFFSFFLSLSLSFLLSMAKDLAARLNAWTREGLDMLGGADQDGIQELLTDFLGDSPGSGSELDSMPDLVASY